MSEFELRGEQTPQIKIERVGGDLRLRGGERPVVSSKDESTDIYEEDDGTVVVLNGGDLSLRVPHDATITIENVGGDAKITELSGDLTLHNIGSDLSLRQIGAATIHNVGSDLRLKTAEGDISIDHVGGDVTLREVAGDTQIGHIGGDLYVRDIDGACEATHIGADLVLSTGFVPGVTYHFDTGGDVVCRIPPDTDARFRLFCGGDIAIDAPGAELSEGEEADEIVFGSGAALVTLQAGGDIRLVEQDEDYMMAINFQLEEDLEARLAGLEEQLAEQLSGLDDLISKRAEKFREKAERQAERALRRTERAFRKNKREFGLSFGGGRTPKAARPQRPPEPSDPVTDEERLMILRMVESKQITVQEAEKLLAALEGRK